MTKTSIICMLALIVLAGGCKNTYTVKTTLHSDGSFEKTVVCEGDSLGLYRLSLPFDFRRGWNIQQKKKNDKSGNFITTATKTYATMDELQAEVSTQKDSSKLNIMSHVDSHFRWFFTYYTYHETIPAFGLFKQHTRFDSAFTPSEISSAAAGKDSLLKQRMDEYWLRNIVDEFIDNLIAHSQALNDPAFAPSRWEKKRDAIASAILETKSSEVPEIIAVIERELETPAARKLERTIESTMKAITEKAERESKLELTYTNEVVMPGMLITSNAQSVEGSTVIWECRAERFTPVEMTAESRSLNLWAVILTSVVCVMLLAGLLFPIVRMRG